MKYLPDSTPSSPRIGHYVNKHDSEFWKTHPGRRIYNLGASLEMHMVFSEGLLGQHLNVTRNGNIRDDYVNLFAGGKGGGVTVHNKKIIFHGCPWLTTEDKSPFSTFLHFQDYLVKL